TDRRAFAAAGNCSDDRADGGADARAGDSLRCLIVALGAALVIDLDGVAINRTNIRKGAGELVCLAVAQPDRVEVESHPGSAREASTLLHVAHRAIYNCAFELTRLAHGDRESVALLRLFGGQVIVQ